MTTQIEKATRSELLEEKNRITARMRESEQRLTDMRESDDPAVRKNWSNETDNYYIDSALLNSVEDRIAALPRPVNGTRSALKRVVEADPVARYIAASAKSGSNNGGLQGLEGWEIEQQAELAKEHGLENQYRDGDLVVPMSTGGRKQNAVWTTTEADGAIPQTTSATIHETLSAFGGARQVCYVMQTMDGADIKIPKADNATAEGAIIAEGAASAEQTLATVGETTLGSYLYESKHTDVSRASVQDAVAGFSVIDYTIRQATRRLGRIINKHATIGTGTNQPEGFWTKAIGNTLHTTAAGGGAEYLTYADLVHLTHADSISPYIDDNGEELGGFGAMRGFTGFTFNRVLEGVLMRMTDGDNRPLWSPGLSSIAGDPRMPTILGYPYRTNQHCPSNMAKNQPIAAFGNIGSSHAYREVGAMIIRSFYDSATASRGDSFRILGFARFDAKYIGAGTSSAVEFGVLKTKNADAA